MRIFEIPGCQRGSENGVTRIARLTSETINISTQSKSRGKRDAATNEVGAFLSCVDNDFVEFGSQRASLSIPFRNFVILLLIYEMHGG